MKGISQLRTPIVWLLLGAVFVVIGAADNLSIGNNLLRLFTLFEL